MKISDDKTVGFMIEAYSKSTREGIKKLTTMSFPAFSGLFAILIAAAAAAPEDIPTWNQMPLYHYH